MRKKASVTGSAAIKAAAAVRVAATNFMVALM